MISKLRFRFILVTMISVVIVLGVIISAINIMNYVKVKNNADDILDMLSENDGQFDHKIPPILNGGMKPDNRNVNEETPFETRFFTITYFNDGGYIVNTSQIAAINEYEAYELAEEVKDSKKGYSGVYRYKVANYSDKTIVIFMDCQRQLSTANSFLIYSAIISLFGILGVFVLVLFLSKRVVLPIAVSYEKQKRFITNAGHELKTPLTIISADNEMIEVENGESDYTASISKQVKRMTSMVKNLTMLSKLDEDGLSNLSLFSLSDAAIDIVNTYKSVFEVNNKKIDYSISQNINYNGNEGLIRNLLTILLDNSLKYSLSHVNMNIKLNGNKILIEISNDTLNISVGNLNHYFERFYRTDESRASSVEGSGIGLSIAKEIVLLHKGEINAYGLEDNIFLIKIVL